MGGAAAHLDLPAAALAGAVLWRFRLLRAPPGIRAGRRLPGVPAVRGPRPAKAAAPARRAGTPGRRGHDLVAAFRGEEFHPDVRLVDDPASALLAGCFAVPAGPAVCANPRPGE